VSASFAGFRAFSDADVQVVSGFDTTLAIRLHMAARADVGPWVTSGDVFQTARLADAIVHLRIERVRGVREVCGVATEYEASVIELVKSHPEGGPAATFEFLQQGSGSVSAEGFAYPDEARYSVGDEFVALLGWSNRLRAFLRSTGPVYMIRIRDGKVAPDVRTPGATPGMAVRELLEKLKISAKPR
jgi:hypothetical protein